MKRYHLKRRTARWRLLVQYAESPDVYVYEVEGRGEPDARRALFATTHHQLRREIFGTVALISYRPIQVIG